MKGLFAQCKDCGHGGHQGHLEEWFRNFGVCPFPGCEHVCVESSEQGAECVPDSPPRSAHAQSSFWDTVGTQHYRAEDGTVLALRQDLLLGGPDPL